VSYLKIEGSEKIERIVKDFAISEIGYENKTLGKFKVVSINLNRQFDADVYEVVCEYHVLPENTDGRRKKLVRVRADSLAVIGCRGL
jgi:hypothetical protein